MNESDWKDNMGELLARHKAKFEEYALRDAEIAVEAYNRLRQFFLQEKYGLDIVNFKTASSLRDRKSTRLNSSHSQISYAVFCLKKKKQQHHNPLSFVGFQRTASTCSR